MSVGFRADLVVAGKVIVEIKSIDAIAPVHRKQLLTYLRLADKRLGLLINFNVELIRDGITRVVNKLGVFAQSRKEKRKAQNFRISGTRTAQSCRFPSTR